MHSRKKYRCERIRKNNGIIEVMFKRDEDGQEEIILINIISQPDRFEEGKHYWWQVEPAFPN